MDEQTHQIVLAQGVWQGLSLNARAWTPESSGDAAPILLFHDSLGSVELWRGFPAALAEATGRRVIAYDRLGFGASDPFPGKMGLDFIAQEARDIAPVVLEHFGVASFVAAGHSVGGCMAVETAAEFGERCAALVTISAQSSVDDRIRAGIRVAEAAFAEPGAMARLEKYHGDKARWVADAWIRTWLSDAFAGWSLDPALAKVKCPTLAIHGADDEYGAPDHARRIARGHGQTVILPGRRHMPHREDEAGVISLIAGFLRSRA